MTATAARRRPKPGPKERGHRIVWPGLGHAWYEPHECDTLRELIRLYDAAGDDEARRAIFAELETLHALKAVLDARFYDDETVLALGLADDVTPAVGL